jgi:hypothetical protein
MEIQECECSPFTKKNWGDRTTDEGLVVCDYCNKISDSGQVDSMKSAAQEVKRQAKQEELLAQREKDLQNLGAEKLSRFEERLRREIEEIEYQSWKGGRGIQTNNTNRNSKAQNATNLSAAALGASILRRNLNSATDNSEGEGFLGGLLD